jgi:hypothetical protein
MRTVFNTKSFKQEMDNIVEYSIGFLDGIHAGKKVFLDNLGRDVVTTLKEFVDSNARMDPAALEHMYEWYESGSPNARLFDIEYTVSGLGLSFNSSFRQSTSIKNGSNVPFYDKARIMENGIPVVIRPKRSSVLVFDENGETIFTRQPVRVQQPGGDSAEGSFDEILTIFFTKYFKQSFLKMSGLSQYLSNPKLYKENLKLGKRVGRSTGLSTGYRWIANAGVA